MNLRFALGSVQALAVNKVLLEFAIRDVACHLF